MNKERLLNVVRALEESKTPEKFDMSRYVYTYTNWCGTPACAIGHYASRRDLQDILEIKTEKKGGGTTLEYTHSDIVYTDKVPENFTQYAGYGICYDSAVIANHFGITEQQCRQLFSPFGCERAKTTKQAADFIRRFVELDGQIPFRDEGEE